MKKYVKFVVMICFLLLYTAAAPGQSIAAAASTFTVTKVADTNDGACNTDCSLREALIAANTNPGADIITVPGGIYILSIGGTGEDAALTGDLDITDDVTINGAGASTTVIDGGRIDRVFHIPTALTVTITGFTIRYGQVEEAGGGIWINSISPAGVTTLEEVVIASNRSANGGGISIPNGGTLLIQNSTINHNTTTGVGGAIQSFNAVVTLTNTTLTGNTASGGGGGGAIYSFAATANLTNTTMYYNASSVGGAIANYGGTVNLSNTILSNNNNQGSACLGALASQGYNLINEAGCALDGDLTGNIIGQDPKLGPLQFNGGPTTTNALASDSPAVNAGSPSAPGSGGNACAAADQRGITRPQNGRCDVGAVELTPGATVVGAVNNPITQSFAPGVVIHLDFGQFGGPPSYTTTTNAFGGFSFMDVPPGQYFLTPFPPSGWIGSGKAITVTGSDTFGVMLSLIKDITLLSPADHSVVSTPTPSLCWEALPQAVSYTLQLNGPGGVLLANPTVSTSCYTVGASLQDGESYSWSLANALNSLGENIGGSTTFHFTYRVPAVIEPIVPAQPTTVTSVDSQTVVEFPANTFTSPGTVTYQTAPDAPSALPLVEVKAYQISASAALAQGAQYVVTVTLTDADTRTVDPSTLALYYWDEGLLRWVKEPTSQYVPGTQTLTASPTHFSTWAVLGDTNRLYLPILSR